MKILKTAILSIITPICFSQNPVNYQELLDLEDHGLQVSGSKLKDNRENIDGSGLEIRRTLGSKEELHSINTPAHLLRLIPNKHLSTYRNPQVMNKTYDGMLDKFSDYWKTKLSSQDILSVELDEVTGSPKYFSKCIGETYEERGSNGIARQKRIRSRDCLTISSYICTQLEIRAKSSKSSLQEFFTEGEYNKQQREALSKMGSRFRFKVYWVGENGPPPKIMSKVDEVLEETIEEVNYDPIERHKELVALCQKHKDIFPVENGVGRPTQKQSSSKN